MKELRTLPAISVAPGEVSLEEFRKDLEDALYKQLGIPRHILEEMNDPKQFQHHPRHIGYT